MKMPMNRLLFSLSETYLLSPRKKSFSVFRSCGKHADLERLKLKNVPVIHAKYHI